MKKGKLFAIGGALNLASDNLILKKFFAEAGEKEARIILVPAYKDNEKKIQRVKDWHEEAFYKFGAKEVFFCRPENGVFDQRAVHKKIALSATGVFFSGGIQRELVEVLKGSEFLEIIKKRHERDGLPVAGTSAGCAVLSEVIIMKGTKEPTLGEGFGLRKDVIFDQHFSSGNSDNHYPRFERLLNTTYKYPDLLGVGVDENTCALVKPNGVLEVIGERSVTIIDSSSAKERIVEPKENIKRLEEAGVKVKTLSSGERFDLNNKNS